MATLGHTSVSNLAVRSLMSLCLIEGRAPVGQLKAYSTEKLQPHTQCEGIRVGFQPYWRHNASLKDPLWRAKLCSAMCSATTQLDAPFSLAISMARTSFAGRLSIVFLAHSCCNFLLLRLMSRLILACSALTA